jgi:branched-chain amino acid transport system permease protein
MAQIVKRPFALGRYRRWAAPTSLAALIALAALIPRLSDRPDTLNLLFLVYLYIALGQSWNILAGFAGQNSLGHAAFFGIGALITRALWLDGFPLVGALLLGGVVACAFGLLIGVPTFRLRGAYFSIGTLGVAEVLRITVGQNLPLITTMTSEQIAGYDLARRYYLALGLALATYAGAALLLRSSLSLGILAVREDEEAAQASGVHVLAHKLLALTISSFFAGLVGGVFAYQQVSYYPEAAFSPIWTFDALLITYVGGLGSLAGPAIGAVFYILIREQLAITLVSAHQIIFGVLFIIIVLVFPGGLVEGWSRLWRGWRGKKPATATAEEHR